MTRMRLFVCCAALAVAVSKAVSVAKSTDNDIVLKVSTDKHSSRDINHFSGEWLESPWGDLYQFRAGDQNWLTAREHCLSLNADLAIIRNVEQLDWILSHYAPLSSRFAQRLVQIGLYAPEGQTHEWKWLDGVEVNSTLQWSSGEPYDHSMEGRERCGLLNVEKRRLDDVDCESTSPDHNAQRYICQRTVENHKQQQRSNNYIWQKIENLFSFFGIGNSATPHNSTATNDYEDEVVKNETESTTATVKFTDSEEETSSEEEASVIKTLAALPKIEGSGESTSLKELEDSEGSGQIVEKKAIELAGGVDEKRLDKMIDKMEEMIKSIDDLTVPPIRTTVATPVIKPAENKEAEETKNEKKEKEEKKKNDTELNDNKVSASIEGDFDQAQSKDMPKADITPPKEKEEDCDENSGSGSGEEDPEEKEADERLSQHLELAPEKEDKIKEFLGVLRLFLDRAEHGDLRKLLDDQSGKTLLERMKNAVREANKREFEMLEKLESANKSGEKADLVKKIKGDPMSTEEQKDLFKKISSAVMKAAKEVKTGKGKKTVQDEPGLEKFNVAKEEINKAADDSEATVEVLKSAREDKGNKTEKTREKKEAKDGDNDIDDDDGVTATTTVAVQKDDGGVKSTTTEESKKDEEKEEELTTTGEPEKKEEAVTTTEEPEKVKNHISSEKLQKKEEEEVKTTTEAAKKEEKEEENQQTTAETTNKEEETTASSSPKPAEAEEDEAEQEASGHEDEDITTTTESTTVEMKEVASADLEKLTKLEAKQNSDDVPLLESSTEAVTTTSASETTTTTETDSTTPSGSTTPVAVSTRKVSVEEIEKLSKMEATEKVTLLPPLPTFTFPTLAPFTFPTLPTLPTTKPTPAPKVPTLEEILGNLNDQFKKLLSPPKPLPK